MNPSAYTIAHEAVRPSLTRVDVFMMVNTVVLASAAWWSYFVTDEEFGLYAVIILILGPLLWTRLRSIRFPVWMLVLLESGVMLHFAGGFIAWGGHSLYGHELLGVGVDKYVHAFNSAVVAVLIGTIFRVKELRLGALEEFIVVMVVCAIGSFVEITEFLVAINVPINGVGGHVNTIGDLMANTVGAIVGYRLWARLGLPSLR